MGKKFKNAKIIQKVVKSHCNMRNCRKKCKINKKCVKSQCKMKNLREKLKNGKNYQILCEITMQNAKLQKKV